MLLLFFLYLFFQCYPLSEDWTDIAYDDLTMFMRDFSRAFGMTYQEGSIFLVCIVMPMLIVFFMFLAWLNSEYKTNLLKRITAVSIAITIIVPFVVLFLLILNASFEQIASRPPH